MHVCGAPLKTREGEFCKNKTEEGRCWRHKASSGSKAVKPKAVKPKAVKPKAVKPKAVKPKAVKREKDTSKKGFWTFKGPKGQLFKISTTCQETYPCQHDTNIPDGEDGDEIWNIIKDYKGLKTSHPDLWKHFEENEK